jgi:hypothetical protein
LRALQYGDLISVLSHTTITHHHLHRSWNPHIHKYMFPPQLEPIPPTFHHSSLAPPPLAPVMSTSLYPVLPEPAEPSMAQTAPRLSFTLQMDHIGASQQYGIQIPSPS